MITLKDFRDGTLIGAMFGVIASAGFVVVWWAMDAILEHATPAEVVGVSAVGCSLVAGVLATIGSDR